MKYYQKKFLLIFSITLLIGLVLFGILFGGAVLGYWGGVDGLDIDSLTLRQNSTLLYFHPETGEERVLQTLNSTENRIWVDLESTPDYLQKAFISIEDERFYTHRGYDLKRTARATLTWLGNKLTFKKGAASLGGSTITQQLIKNITGKDEQTPARKIQEISRAVALEKKMDKDQILELYLNCIYLSQGCSGVQTAANLYFDKDVEDLSLAEAASIAGITQYPSLYDPFVNPEKNKERQELVLSKMLELGYITQAEHDAAVEETLVFANADGTVKKQSGGTTSYFVDQVIRDVLRDLQAKGYSETLANKLLYSGGIKIYTTYNPDVQPTLEKYYADSKNFPEGSAQSAMTIIDVQTGAVVGIAGGIGEKPGSLTLNRATSPRQPGSAIKPIGVYAPAIDRNLITPASLYQDKPISYGGWTPRNYDRQYSHSNIDIRTAVRRSLNTIPVQILSEMGAQESFNYLTEKFGLTTLVSSRTINDKVYSDIGLSQLALGGLTDGVSTLEMAAAFATFANGGVYHQPYIYTEVKDREGNLLLSSEHTSKQAIKSSTAYVMHKMLQEVVSGGTGQGAGISGVPTAGKTGTTSDNNDRWFVGYTPYYAAAIWYGHDIPQEISVGYNPCISIFRNVMGPIHRNLHGYREIPRPKDVVSIEYCSYSGMRATPDCPTDTYYFVKNNIPAYCTSSHPGYVPEEEEGQEGEEGEETTPPTSTSTTEGTTPNSAKPSQTSPTQPSGGTTTSSTPSLEE